MAAITRQWQTDVRQKFSNGAVPTVHLVELDGDKFRRRVYEDWSTFNEHTVKCFVNVKNERLYLTKDQIKQIGHKRGRGA